MKPKLLGLNWWICSRQLRISRDWTKELPQSFLDNFAIHRKLIHRKLWLILPRGKHGSKICEESATCRIIDLLITWLSIFSGLKIEKGTRLRHSARHEPREYSSWIAGLGHIPLWLQERAKILDSAAVERLHEVPGAGLKNLAVDLGDAHLWIFTDSKVSCVHGRPLYIFCYHTYGYNHFNNTYRMSVGLW